MVEGEPVIGAKNPPANTWRNHEGENKNTLEDDD
jgi:hypothetical protein